MEINTWLLITLFVSSALNGSLFWLVREQSSRLATTADNAEDLLEMINGFKNHLKAVYSLETFYGDETLKALMDHATSLSIILEEQYGEIASLSEPVEIIEEEEEQDGSEENQNEKHVFYAGTRRRDS